MIDLHPPSVTLTDFSRAVLTFAWFYAAWLLLRAQRRGPNRSGLRLFGGIIALLSGLFLFCFQWALHAGWNTAWHNEAARFLDAMTATVFIVWGLTSRRLGREQHDD